MPQFAQWGSQQPEEARLQALYGYHILDTAPEEEYDALLTLTVSIFKAPIAAITFLDKDRVWFKAKTGFALNQVERLTSFCQYTVRTDQITEVEDTTAVSPYKNLPMVTHYGVKYYISVPLITPKGFILGNLCLFDFEPRRFSPEEKEMLKTLARQVMTQLELDAHSRSIKEKEEKLQAYRNKLDNYRQEMEQISYAISHELKSPLRAINNLAEWVGEELQDTQSAEIKTNLSLMRGRVHRLENLFNGLLTYAKVRREKAQPEEVNTWQLVSTMAKSLEEQYQVNIFIPLDLPVIYTEKKALETVFKHLLQNAPLHNKNLPLQVRISWAWRSPNLLEFSVIDNGAGIAPEYHDKVFGMFKTLEPGGGEENTGIGLAIVKGLLQERQGQISLQSEPAQGCVFTFTWPL
ncbi:MAG: GAF domain-containing sensor histidine kinase [Rufibacter sp.]